MFAIQARYGGQVGPNAQAGRFKQGFFAGPEAVKQRDRIGTRQNMVLLIRAERNGQQRRHREIRFVFFYVDANRCAPYYNQNPVTRVGYVYVQIEMINQFGFLVAAGANDYSGGRLTEVQTRKYAQQSATSHVSLSVGQLPVPVGALLLV